MSEFEAMHNDPIVDHSRRLTDLMTSSSNLDIPSLLPHLLNLSCLSEGARKSLMPVNLPLPEFSAWSSAANLAGDMQLETHPGFSVFTVAERLENWNQLRNLGVLFMIESEMMKEIFVISSFEMKYLINLFM